MASKTSKLFDNKFLSNCSNNCFQCPKCKREYTVFSERRFGNDSPRSFANLPMLLKCGHNMCEKCFHQNRQQLHCAVCLIPVDLKNLSYLEIRDLIELDFFLVGKLYYFKVIRDEQKNQDYRCYMQRKRNNSDFCAECDVNPAVGFCRSCNVKYCTACFDKIHNSSRILRAHILEMASLKKAKLRRRVLDDTIEYYAKRICKTHKYHFHFYCKKCSMECCKSCIKYDHDSHYYVTISEENMRSRGEIDFALEFLKNADEKVHQAQMTLKFTEKQFTTYAMETCDDISAYFQNLHKSLQNKERTIMDYFKDVCEKPQKSFENALINIGKAEENLTKIRSSLEYFQQSIPTNFIIKDILDDYYNEIEHLSYTTNVVKLENNPFSIQLNDDVLQDLSKFIEYSYIEQENFQYIEMDLESEQPKNTKTKRPQNHNTSFMKTVANKRQKNESKNSNSDYFHLSSVTIKSNTLKKIDSDLSQEMMTLSIRDTISAKDSKIPINKLSAFMDKDEKVLVTAVKNPLDFFVQSETVLNLVKNIANDYKNLEDTMPLLPFKIKINKLYMIYVPKEERWYRGKVLKSGTENRFSCLLVDYGVNIDTYQERILKTSFGLDNIPYAALHCSIHGIESPNSSNWSDKDIFIFRELTKEQYFGVHIINSEAQKIEVDLIPYDSPNALSIRASLLYTGIAIDKTFEKQDFPVASKCDRIKIDKLPCNVLESVKILDVEDPFEFYVSMTKDNHNYRNMMDQMNHEFQENKKSLCSNIIYNGSLKQACMCHFEGKVFRGCIEQINQGGNITVRFVDEGTTETVHWDQLYVLPNYYKQLKEFSCKCCLTDIEPLQSNNYVWTNDALLEFKTLMRNKNIFMEVITFRNDHYKVNMFVEKGNQQFNIGALLVMKNLAISSGPSTMSVTVIQSNIPDVEPSEYIETIENKPLKTSKEIDKEKGAYQENSLQSVKRTNILIVHLVDPGEFYVIRSNDFNGIKIFNEHIQKYMEQTKSNPTNSSLNPIRQWTIEDDCLVLTTLKKCKSNIFNLNTEKIPKWYRGQIKGISVEHSSDTSYIVYLRDVGVSIDRISEDCLHPMPEAFKKISDAAYRCHLACIKPFDETSIWPKNSIDFFKKLLTKYEGFQVTMQNKQDTIKNSFPVIVWGIKTNATNALTPFVTNYTNFIRLFVVNGMARMTKRLDFTKEMNKILKMDLNEGEISWDDYMQKIFKNPCLTTEITKSNNNDFRNKLDNENIIDDDCKDLLEYLDDLNEEITTPNTPIPKKWLESRIITKTIFVAYPTYVDYQANIYLHEYDIRQIHDIMSAKIVQKYVPKIKTFDQKNHQYGVNQPCLVQYHQNKQYYRGIIQKSKETKQYDVLFIDFGNIEECDTSELLPFAPFKELPVLSSKYYLVNIQPKNGSSKHTIECLDVIHKMLVGVMVNVQVTDISFDGDSTPCKIRLNGKDVAKDLVEYGYVDWISNEENITTNSPSKTLKQIHGKKNKSLLSDEYVKLFKRTDECSLGKMDTSSEYKNEIFVTSFMDETTINDKPISGFASKKISKSMKFKSESDICSRPTASVKPLYDHSEYQEFFKSKKMFNDPKVIDDIINCEMEGEVKMNVLDLLDECKTNVERSDYRESFGNMFIDEINDSDVEQRDIIETEPNYSMELWPQDEYISPKHIEKESNKFLTSLENPGKTFEQMDLDQYANPTSIDSLTMDTLTMSTTMLSTSQRNVSWLTNFIPNDTSTVITTFSSLNLLKPIQLPFGVKKFPCEISYMTSPISFYIFPTLADFSIRFKELRKAINYEIANKRRQDLDEFEVGTFCLACFSKDNLWYRAIIRSTNSKADTVEVLYVDYLNSENLKKDQLRKIPKHLIEKWPARVMKVHFPDVKLNPNKSMTEATNAFKKALNNNYRAYAQIKLPTKIKNKSNANRSLLPYDDNLISTSLPNINFDDEEYSRTNFITDDEHEEIKNRFLSTPIELFEDSSLQKSISKELLKKKIFLID